MNEVLFRFDQFDWTAERVGELKAYIGVGKTPWHIATLMRCSRTTVVQAMIKLMARPEGPPEAEHEKEPRVEVRTPSPITLATVYVRDPETPYPTTRSTKVPRRHVVDIPTHPVELLTSTRCHYPIGHVGSPGFRFCMTVKDNDNTPYCKVHRKLTRVMARRY